MTIYNQRTPSGKTYRLNSLNGIEVESYIYVPSTLNEGAPWTIREIIIAQHGPFIADAIIKELKIDTKRIVFDLDLSGVDFATMTGDELLKFWGRFGG